MKIFHHKNILLNLAIMTTLSMNVFTGFNAKAAPLITQPLPIDRQSTKLDEQSKVEERHLEIIQGKVEILEGIAPDRIAVGNGDLLEVKVLDNQQLLLIGKNTGTTSLRVWTLSGQERNYKVVVRPPEMNMDITMRKIVRMRVKMIEFRASTLKEIGVDWMKTANGPSFGLATQFGHNTRAFPNPSMDGVGGLMEGGYNFSSIFNLSSVIDSTLKFMEQTGDASILAQPTLSCLSGESASFVAGGEVPFSVVDSNGQTNVSFKQYGIMLEVSPYADRNGRIYTAINTEVSQIDSSVTVNGAPGFLTRRTETHMNVVSGQTIVISGLLSKDSSNTIEQLPGAGNIPVLGNLFKSKSYKNNQTQLVILVTPEIIDPEHQYQQDKVPQVAQSLLKRQAAFQRVLNRNLSDIDIQITH